MTIMDAGIAKVVRIINNRMNRKDPEDGLFPIHTNVLLAKLNVWCQYTPIRMDIVMMITASCTRNILMVLACLAIGDEIYDAAEWIGDSWSSINPLVDGDMSCVTDDESESKEFAPVLIVDYFSM